MHLNFYLDIWYSYLLAKGSGTAEWFSRIPKHLIGFNGFFVRRFWKLTSFVSSASLSIWNNSSSRRSENGVLEWNTEHVHLNCLVTLDAQLKKWKINVINKPKSFFESFIIKECFNVFGICMFPPRFLIFLWNLLILYKYPVLTFLVDH